MMAPSRSFKLKSVDQDTEKDCDDVTRDQREAAIGRDRGSERSEPRTGLWFWEVEDPDLEGEPRDDSSTP